MRAGSHIFYYFLLRPFVSVRVVGTENVGRGAAEIAPNHVNSAGADGVIITTWILMRLGRLTHFVSEVNRLDPVTVFLVWLTKGIPCVISEVPAQSFAARQRPPKNIFLRFSRRVGYYPARLFNKSLEKSGEWLAAALLGERIIRKGNGDKGQFSQTIKSAIKAELRSGRLVGIFPAGRPSSRGEARKNGKQFRKTFVEAVHELETAQTDIRTGSEVPIIPVFVETNILHESSIPKIIFVSLFRKAWNFVRLFFLWGVMDRKESFYMTVVFGEPVYSRGREVEAVRLQTAVMIKELERKYSVEGARLATKRDESVRTGFSTALLEREDEYLREQLAIKIKEKGKVFYEINARELKKPFHEISDEELDRIAALGTTVIWMMGSWKTGKFTEDFNKMWDGNRVGSAFSIDRYVMNPELGGESSFVDFRRRANRKGMVVILDIVPNHMAADTELLKKHPEAFITLKNVDPNNFPTLQDYLIGKYEFMEKRFDKNRFYKIKANNGDWIVAAHGRSDFKDESAWLDTVQGNLNHWVYRKIMIEAIAYTLKLTNGGGFRIDMDHYTRSAHVNGAWLEPTHQEKMNQEFWSHAAESFRLQYPDAVMIAEAYDHGGRKESFGTNTAELQSFGHLTYDSHAYHLLVENDTSTEMAQEIVRYATQRWDYHKNAVHYTENHDEPENGERVAKRFGSADRHRAALIIKAGVFPGGLLIHRGQELGYSESKPTATWLHTDLYPESPDKDLEKDFQKILNGASRSLFREGRVFLLPPADHGNFLVSNDIIAVQRLHESERALVVVNYSPRSAYFYYKPKLEGWAFPGAASSGQWQWRELVSGRVIPFSEALGSREQPLAPWEGKIYVLEPSGARLAVTDTLDKSPETTFRQSALQSDSGLDDPEFEKAVVGHFKKVRKIVLHEHTSGLIYPEDLLPYFLGESDTAREARRRFAILWKAFKEKKDPLYYQANRVKSTDIPQDEADQIFEKEIGISDVPTKGKVRRLERFVTYQDRKARDWKRFEWCFTFIKAVTDVNPEFRNDLVEKGLWRLYKEEGVRYIEITDYHSASIQKLAQRILEVEKKISEANPGDPMHIAILKAFRKDHLETVLQDDTQKQGFLSHFAGMNLEEVKRRVLNEVLVQDHNRFGVAEEKIRKEFKEAFEEIKRQMARDAKIPAEDLSDEIVRERLILAYAAREKAYEDIRMFEGQLDDMEKENPKARKRIVGVSSVGDEVNYINWVQSPILRRAQKIGLKVTSHVGERWLEAQRDEEGRLVRSAEYVPALQRIEREIEAGADRLAHLTVLGLNFDHRNDLTAEEKALAKKLQRKIWGDPQGEQAVSEEPTVRGLLKEKGLHIETNPTSQISFSQAYSSYEQHLAGELFARELGFSISPDDGSILKASPSREIFAVWRANPDMPYHKILSTFHFWPRGPRFRKDRSFDLMRAADNNRFYQPVSEVADDFDRERDLLREVQETLSPNETLPPAVTFIGSARTGEKEGPENEDGRRVYERARETGRATPFAVRTGGATGVMEAALRGKKEAGGDLNQEALRQAIGIILKGWNEPWNDYAGMVYPFDVLAFRTMALYVGCSLVIGFPGGLGTLSEVFHALRRDLPLALMMVDYWKEIIEAFEESWREANLSHQIRSRPLLTDSIEEALSQALALSQGNYMVTRNEEEEERAKRELRAGLVKLDELAKPVAVVGRPNPGSEELKILSASVAKLLAKGISVRIGSSGPVLSAVLEGIKIAEKEYGVERKKALSLVQTVLYKHDKDNELEPSLKLLQESYAEFPEEYERNTLILEDDANHQILLSYDARSYLFLPGGVGTMDKLFDPWVAEQVGKIRRRPLVLIEGENSEFWDRILRVLKKKTENFKPPLVSPGHIHLARVAKSAGQAVHELGIDERPAGFVLWKHFDRDFRGGDQDFEYRYPQRFADALLAGSSSNDEPLIVVDVGSAKGDTSQWLLRRSPRFRVLGLERDADLVSESKKRVLDAGFHVLDPAGPSGISDALRMSEGPGVLFKAIDATSSLLLPDASANGLILHRLRDSFFPPEREHLADEARRIIAPGGFVSLEEDMLVEPSDPEGKWYQKRYLVNSRLILRLLDEGFLSPMYQPLVNDPRFRLMLSIRNLKGLKIDETLFENREEEIVKGVMGGRLKIRGVGIHEPKSQVIQSFRDRGFSVEQEWTVKIPESGDRAGHHTVLKGVLFRATSGVRHKASADFSPSAGARMAKHETFIKMAANIALASIPFVIVPIAFYSEGRLDSETMKLVMRYVSLPSLAVYAMGDILGYRARDKKERRLLSIAPAATVFLTTLFLISFNSWINLLFLSFTGTAVFISLLTDYFTGVLFTVFEKAKVVTSMSDFLDARFLTVLSAGTSALGATIFAYLFIFDQAPEKMVAAGNSMLFFYLYVTTSTLASLFSSINILWQDHPSTGVRHKASADSSPSAGARLGVLPKFFAQLGVYARLLGFALLASPHARIRFKTSGMSPYNDDIVKALLFWGDRSRHFVAAVNRQDEREYEIMRVRAGDMDAQIRPLLSPGFEFISHLYPEIYFDKGLKRYLRVDSLIRELPKVLIVDDANLYEQRYGERHRLEPWQLSEEQEALYLRAKNNIESLLNDRKFFPQGASVVRDHLMIMGVFTETTLLVPTLDTAYQWGLLRNSHVRPLVYVPIRYFADIDMRNAEDVEIAGSALQYAWKWHGESHKWMRQGKLPEEIHKHMDVFNKRRKSEKSLSKRVRLFIRHVPMYLSDRVKIFRLKRVLYKSAGDLERKAIELENKLEKKIKGVRSTGLSQAALMEERDRSVSGFHHLEDFLKMRNDVADLENEAVGLASRALSLGAPTFAIRIHRVINNLFSKLALVDSGMIVSDRYMGFLITLLRASRYNEFHKALYDLKKGLLPLAKGSKIPMTREEKSLLLDRLRVFQFLDWVNETYDIQEASVTRADTQALIRAMRHESDGLIRQVLQELFTSITSGARLAEAEKIKIQDATLDQIEEALEKSELSKSQLNRTKDIAGQIIRVIKDKVYSDSAGFEKLITARVGTPERAKVFASQFDFSPRISAPVAPPPKKETLAFLPWIDKITKEARESYRRTVKFPPKLSVGQKPELLNLSRADSIPQVWYLAEYHHQPELLDLTERFLRNHFSGSVNPDNWVFFIEREKKRRSAAYDAGNLAVKAAEHLGISIVDPFYTFNDEVVFNQAVQRGSERGLPEDAFLGYIVKGYADYYSKGDTTIAVRRLLSDGDRAWLKRFPEARLLTAAAGNVASMNQAAYIMIDIMRDLNVQKMNGYFSFPAGKKYVFVIAGAGHLEEVKRVLGIPYSGARLAGNEKEFEKHLEIAIGYLEQAREAIRIVRPEEVSGIDYVGKLSGNERRRVKEDGQKNKSVWIRSLDGFIKEITDISGTSRSERNYAAIHNNLSFLYNAAHNLINREILRGLDFWSFEEPSKSALDHLFQAKNRAGAFIKASSSDKGTSATKPTGARMADESKEPQGDSLRQEKMPFILVVKLSHPNWIVRATAVKALGFFCLTLVNEGKEVSLRSLESKLYDPDSRVHSTASDVLGPIYNVLVNQGKMSLQVLEAKLDDSSWPVFHSAANALGPIYASLVNQGKMPFETLEAKLRDRHGAIRLSASKALGPIYINLFNQGKMPLQTLEAKLKEFDYDIRRAAVTTLASIYAALVGQGKMSLQSLEAKLNDSTVEVRDSAFTALGSIYVSLVNQGRMSLQTLEAKLGDLNPSVRYSAILALGPLYTALLNQGKEVSLQTLELKLKASDAIDDYLAACNALGPMYAALVSQGKMSLESLEAKINDPSRGVESFFITALGSIYAAMAGNQISEDNLQRILLWDREGLPYDEKILEESLGFPPDEFISYYRSKLALRTLIEFLKQGDPIHHFLDKLRQKGLYNDSVYNRAITAYASKRGWVSWQTGSILMTSYGTLKDSKEVPPILVSPMGRPIRTNTSLVIESKETDPFGYTKAKLIGKEQVSFLLYQKGYKAWKAYQDSPEKRKDSPIIFLFGVAPNGSKIFYLTSWGEVLSCCNLYRTFEEEYKTFAEVNKRFKSAFEAFQFQVSRTYYEGISGHAEAINHRIRHVLGEEPSNFLSEFSSADVSLKVNFAIDNDAAKSFGLKWGAFREDIPANNLLNLLGFLETEGVIPKSDVPPPGPLTDEFGLSLTLFDAIHQKKLILWVKQTPDSSWEAWTDNPWAKAFQPGASIRLRLFEMGIPKGEEGGLAGAWLAFDQNVGEAIYHFEFALQILGTTMAYPGPMLSARNKRMILEKLLNPIDGYVNDLMRIGEILDGQNFDTPEYFPAEVLQKVERIKVRSAILLSKIKSIKEIPAIVSNTNGFEYVQDEKSRVVQHLSKASDTIDRLHAFLVTGSETPTAPSSGARLAEDQNFRDKVRMELEQAFQKRRLKIDLKEEDLSKLLPLFEEKPGEVHRRAKDITWKILSRVRRQGLTPGNLEKDTEIFADYLAGKPWSKRRPRPRHRRSAANIAKGVQMIWDTQKPLFSAFVRPFRSTPGLGEWVSLVGSQSHADITGYLFELKAADCLLDFFGREDSEVIGLNYSIPTGEPNHTAEADILFWLKREKLGFLPGLYLVETVYDSRRSSVGKAKDRAHHQLKGLAKSAQWLIAQHGINVKQILVVIGGPYFDDSGNFNRTQRRPYISILSMKFDPNAVASANVGVEKPTEEEQRRWIDDKGAPSSLDDLLDKFPDLKEGARPETSQFFNPILLASSERTEKMREEQDGVHNVWSSQEPIHKELQYLLGEFRKVHGILYVLRSLGRNPDASTLSRERNRLYTTWSLLEHLGRDKVKVMAFDTMLTKEAVNPGQISKIPVVVVIRQDNLQNLPAGIYFINFEGIDQIQLDSQIRIAEALRTQHGISVVGIINATLQNKPFSDVLLKRADTQENIPIYSYFIVENAQPTLPDKSIEPLSSFKLRRLHSRAKSIFFLLKAETGARLADQETLIWPDSLSRISPLKSLFGTLASSFLNALISVSEYGGWMRISTALKDKLTDKFSKSLSRVMIILFSLLAFWTISRSDVDGLTLEMSWPILISSLVSFSGMFSSARNSIQLRWSVQKGSVLGSSRTQPQSEARRERGPKTTEDNNLAPQFARVLRPLPGVQEQHKPGFLSHESRVFHGRYGDSRLYTSGQPNPSYLSPGRKYSTDVRLHQVNRPTGARMAEIEKILSEETTRFLTPEEAAVVFSAYHDPEFTDKDRIRRHLVDRYRYFIISAARRAFGSKQDFDEDYQAAAMAFLRAVNSYDPAHRSESGNPAEFSAYVFTAMLRQIRRARDKRKRPVVFSERSEVDLRKISEVEEKLISAGQRRPMPEEIANQTGLKLETVTQLLKARKTFPRVSLDQPIGQGEGSLYEMIPGKEDVSSFGIEDQIVKDALLSQVERLPLREKQIIQLYFGLGANQGKTHTGEEIGLLLGLSRSRVYQIVDEVLLVLKSGLESGSSALPAEDSSPAERRISPAKPGEVEFHGALLENALSQDVPALLRSWREEGNVNDEMRALIRRIGPEAEAPLLAELQSGFQTNPSARFRLFVILALGDVGRWENSGRTLFYDYYLPLQNDPQRDTDFYEALGDAIRHLDYRDRHGALASPAGARMAAGDDGGSPFYSIYSSEDVQVLDSQPESFTDIVNAIYKDKPHPVSVEVRKLPQALQDLLQRVRFRSLFHDDINAYDYLKENVDEVIFTVPFFRVDEGGLVHQTDGTFYSGDISKLDALSLTNNPDRPGKRVIYINPSFLLTEEGGKAVTREEELSSPKVSHVEFEPSFFVDVIVEETAHVETVRWVIEHQLNLSHLSDFRLRKTWMEKIGKTIRLNALGNFSGVLDAPFVETLTRNLQGKLQVYNTRLGLPENDFGYDHFGQLFSGANRPMADGAGPQGARMAHEIWLDKLYELGGPVLRKLMSPEKYEKYIRFVTDELGFPVNKEGIEAFTELFNPVVDEAGEVSYPNVFPKTFNEWIVYLLINAHVTVLDKVLAIHEQNPEEFTNHFSPMQEKFLQQLYQFHSNSKDVSLIQEEDGVALHVARMGYYTVLTDEVKAAELTKFFKKYAIGTDPASGQTGARMALLRPSFAKATEGFGGQTDLTAPVLRSSPQVSEAGARMADREARLDSSARPEKSAFKSSLPKDDVSNLHRRRKELTAFFNKLREDKELGLYWPNEEQFLHWIHLKTGRHFETEDLIKTAVLKKEGGDNSIEYYVEWALKGAKPAALTESQAPVSKRTKSAQKEIQKTDFSTEDLIALQAKASTITQDEELSRFPGFADLSSLKKFVERDAHTMKIYPKHLGRLRKVIYETLEQSEIWKSENPTAAGLPREARYLVHYVVDEEIADQPVTRGEFEEFSEQAIHPRSKDVRQSVKKSFEKAIQNHGRLRGLARTLDTRQAYAAAERLSKSIGPFSSGARLAVTRLPDVSPDVREPRGSRLAVTKFSATSLDVREPRGSRLAEEKTVTGDGTTPAKTVSGRVALFSPKSAEEILYAVHPDELKEVLDDFYGLKTKIEQQLQFSNGYTGHQRLYFEKKFELIIGTLGRSLKNLAKEENIAWANPIALLINKIEEDIDRAEGKEAHEGLQKEELIEVLKVVRRQALILAKLYDYKDSRHPTDEEKKQAGRKADEEIRRAEEVLMEFIARYDEIAKRAQEPDSALLNSKARAEASLRTWENRLKLQDDQESGNKTKKFTQGEVASQIQFYKELIAKIRKIEEEARKESSQTAAIWNAFKGHIQEVYNNYFDSRVCQVRTGVKYRMTNENRHFAGLIYEDYLIREEKDAESKGLPKQGMLLSRRGIDNPRFRHIFDEVIDILNQINARLVTPQINSSSEIPAQKQAQKKVETYDLSVGSHEGDIILLINNPLSIDVFEKIWEKYGGRIKGIITTSATLIAYWVIISQGYPDPPAVLVVQDKAMARQLKALKAGEPVIFSTSSEKGKSIAYTHPSAKHTADLEMEKRRQDLENKMAEKQIGKPTLFPIFANVDPGQGEGFGMEAADGVGLVRTEIWDLDMKDLMNQLLEAEERKTSSIEYALRKKLGSQYSALLKRPSLAGKKVTFRTFDIHETKNKELVERLNQKYPGMQSVTGFDFYRTEEGAKALIQQIASLCLLYNSLPSQRPILRIMFPQVKEVSDLDFIQNQILPRVRRVIGKEGARKLRAVEFGVMVETKEASANIQEILKHPLANFLSVGTNDLTADLLGISHDLPQFEDEASRFNPHVLEEIKRLAAVLRDHNEQNHTNKELGFCGEIAGTDKFLLFILYLKQKYKIPVYSSMTNQKIAMGKYLLRETDKKRPRFFTALFQKLELNNTDDTVQRSARRLVMGSKVYHREVLEPLNAQKAELAKAEAVQEPVGSRLAAQRDDIPFGTRLKLSQRHNIDPYTFRKRPVKTAGLDAKARELLREMFALEFKIKKLDARILAAGKRNAELLNRIIEIEQRTEQLDQQVAEFEVEEKDVRRQMAGIRSEYKGMYVTNSLLLQKKGRLKVYQEKLDLLEQTTKGIGKVKSELFDALREVINEHSKADAQIAVLRQEKQAISKKKEDAERLFSQHTRYRYGGATDSVSGSRLAGFFEGVALAAPTGGRLSIKLLEDQDSFIFDVKVDHGRLVAEEIKSFGGPKIRIERDISRKKQKDRSAFSAGAQPRLSLPDVRRMTDGVNDKVHGFLSTVPISSEKPEIVEIDLDFLPDGNEFYLDHILDEIRHANAAFYGSNVFYRVTGKNSFLFERARASALFLGEEIPPDLKDAKVIKMTPAFRGLWKDKVNIPLDRLKEGDIFPARAWLMLTIYSGRIDLRKMPEGFKNAYSTLAGQMPETEVLLSILEGRADIQTAVAFALKPLTHVDLNQAVRFFALVRKMTEQAA